MRLRPRCRVEIEQVAIPSDSEGTFSDDSDEDFAEPIDIEGNAETPQADGKNRKTRVKKKKGVQRGSAISEKGETTRLVQKSKKSTRNNANERGTVWRAGKENQNANDVPTFTGEPKINIDGSTPYEFFIQMFPKSIIESISTESLRYARQKGNENFSVSAEEIEIFLGINIVMTYVKYPESRMYWSSSSALRMDLIADCMSVNRFEEIKRYLHSVNNDEHPDNDKYWKIRPILDELHHSFHSAVEPQEHQSIDEMMVPFKGRSELKQYLKNKPKRWGFKFWVRASATGYVHCFEPYQQSDTARSAFGPIGDSVIRLCHGLEDKNHKLFMDNLFTTYQLLKYFQSKGIGVLGTVRLQRLPGANEKLVSLQKLKLPRGSATLASSSDNITVVRWLDNKEVHTVSTYAGVEPTDNARRWDKKEKRRISISRPFSIREYNKFMGGVDLADRMVAHYPHGFKNKKWYLRIFYHFVNVALVNAWLCYREKKDEEMSLLSFKSLVAYIMIHGGQPGSRKRGRPSSELVAAPPPKRKRQYKSKMVSNLRYDGLGHYPTKTNARGAARCHESTCHRRTRYLCKKCEEPVCPECMENFHTL